MQNDGSELVVFRWCVYLSWHHAGATLPATVCEELSLYAQGVAGLSFTSSTSVETCLTSLHASWDFIVLGL
jgi:hypothetical protein